jgi:rubrerythrin
MSNDQDREELHKSTGWICPRCKNAIAPTMKTCPLCPPPTRVESSFSAQQELLID